MKCKHCFIELLKGYKRCSYCGNELHLFGSKKASNEPKNDFKNDNEYEKTIKSLQSEIIDLKLENKKLKNQIDSQDIFHISYVDKLDGLEFEEYIKVLLEKLGYENVFTTPASGDYGIDVLAEKEGIKYGIQCKNYKENLGNKCVQEAFCGKEYYKCHIGIVVTNSYFTPNAISQAKNTGIILWDRDKLIELMNRAR